MELALRETKALLSELVTAARNGERVITTIHGQPAVELVRCDGGDRERWSEEFNDPGFSRCVLGLDDE